jgi:flagellar FliL protein
MATNAQAAPPAPPPPRVSRLVIALVAALSICTLGLLAYVLRGGIGPLAGSAGPAAAAPEKPIFVTLEPVTVNLQGEGRSRFLHIGLALRVRDEQTQARIAEAMPELRSRLLLLLSNRVPESLLSPQDKAKLADEIRDELNRPLAAGSPPQGIAAVAFNAFVVQ